LERQLVKWESSNGHRSCVLQAGKAQKPSRPLCLAGTTMDARTSPMNTEDQLRQFVDLWSQLQGVQLQKSEDTISWRFESSEKYSARSVYDAQFVRTFPDHNWRKVWKIKAEPKCCFFIWLLQLKLSTADRIIKRGGQADPICKLCHCRQETHLHMMAKCSYAKRLWQQVGLTHNVHGLSTTMTNMKEWWTQITKTQGQEDEVQRTRLITYTVWNLWKERCRRVFDNKARSTQELLQDIINDVQMQHLVFEDNQ
jgi:hypothetical protein